MIGALLIAAGLIELSPDRSPRSARPYAMAAGGVTALAGLLFVLNPRRISSRRVTPVIALAADQEPDPRARKPRVPRARCGSGRHLSAGIDFLLGRAADRRPLDRDHRDQPVRADAPLVASFAWFLAASFVVNGLLLLEVASCERERATG